MKASVRWLNRYLEPAGISPTEADRALMNAGLPIESAETMPGGDVCLDVEVTSNRGDCLSHLALARELAAKTGRALKKPANLTVPTDPTPASSLIAVENREPKACPRFTVHVIRGVKVGPSPAWLREALEAVGQRSINNVVDVTNFINFELGQPCHAFDLNKLAQRKLVIRFAWDKEELTTLDGKKRVLKPDELVVADAERAQGLAGVMGGGDSEVSAATTDVALEVATWDPTTVRRTARRHGLRTDASHRYERIVDARTVDQAAERAAALLAEVSGGRLCAGAVVAGPELAPFVEVRLRPSRCRAIAGVHLETTNIINILASLEIQVRPTGRGGEDLVCTIPPHRPDLEREIDLIEEVARIKGLDAVPMHEKLAVIVKPPQNTERARREVSALLAGQGFYETVTFSFCTRAHAKLFLPAGLSVVEVDDERRKEEPALRPSVLTGLLACRGANANAGVHVEGGVRLFEVAAVYAQHGEGPAAQSVENINLALLMDVPAKGKSATIADLQSGVRALRGTIESVVRACAGATAALTFEPATPHAAAFDPSAYARISLDGQPLGYLGLSSKAAISAFDLALPVVLAEINFPALVAMYPPKAKVTPLPAFPAIERDVSFIVGEGVPWAKLSTLIAGQGTSRLEHWSFIGTYRGPQIGAGKKSVTVRLRFRDAERTLRHEEVDAPVEQLVGKIKAETGAEIRV